LERVFERSAEFALILALLLFSCSNIPDISGVWQGESFDSITPDIYIITLVISQDGNEISGRYTHSLWGSGSIISGTFDGAQISFFAKSDKSSIFNSTVTAQYIDDVIIGEWNGFENFTLRRYK